MKRVADSPDITCGPSILALLLYDSRIDRNLRHLVLSYCYRKANVLARSCKALATLVAERAYWQRGVQRELRAFLATLRWSQPARDYLCAHFDPWWNGWPAQMPAVYYTFHGEMLSWIWDRDLIREGDSIGEAIWIRDRKRFHRWIWRCDVILKDVNVEHTWTAYRHDYEGDHWYGMNNGMNH